MPVNDAHGRRFALRLERAGGFDRHQRRFGRPQCNLGLAMLSLEQVRQIEALDAGDGRILSLYLDLDPARQIKRSYRIVFKDLVKDTRVRLDEALQGDLQCEAEKVEHWLDGQKPQGLGLALFSCAPRNVWQPLWLALRTHDHIAYDPRADVAPLLEMLDDYERYAVVLTDKQTSRLFTVFAGEIEEDTQVRDYVPPKHDQGGPSQANFQRHHEAHVQRHLDEAVRRLTELARRRQFDRIIVMGPSEATSELQRRLPRQLAARVVAVVPGKIDWNEKAILSRAREIEDAVERDYEARLLKRLIDAQGPKGLGVVGTSTALEALWERDVMMLIVAYGAHAAGNECLKCDRLHLGSNAVCAACGGRTRPLHDVFHRAIAVALEQRANVEVVHGDAAQRLMALGGGLGAMRRFVPRAAGSRPTAGGG
jgi:peptide chain release factor subunit 1